MCILGLEESSQGVFTAALSFSAMVSSFLEKRNRKNKEKDIKVNCTLQRTNTCYPTSAAT
jgi:hypothetical protein